MESWPLPLGNFRDLLWGMSFMDSKKPLVRSLWCSFRKRGNRISCCMITVSTDFCIVRGSISILPLTLDTLGSRYILISLRINSPFSQIKSNITEGPLKLLTSFIQILAACLAWFWPISLFKLLTFRHLCQSYTKKSFFPLPWTKLLLNSKILSKKSFSCRCSISGS